MAACLRSAVGFYNGGGVNPQPTPVPTTDLATYREIEWNGAPLKVLCDTYGRLFTNYDSANDVYTGLGWADAGLEETFDSIESHQEAFMSEIHRYGENPAVTRFGPDNAEVNIDGFATEFQFENGECVPVPSLWQQGTVKTLFYRKLNNGGTGIDVLCDADGKLIVSEGENPSYVEYVVSSEQIGLRTANIEALIAAADGSVVADILSDNDGNYLLVSLNDYTVVADLDGIVLLGEITVWPVSALVRSIQVPYSGGNVNIPVDKYGRVMVMHVADGNVNYTPWWVDGNQIAVFDDAADQVLVDAMRDHGYVDCLSFTQVSDITVTIDGQSEHLIFGSETKKFNMFVPGWQNAEANLLYRSFTLTGGTEISAVIDADSGSLAIVRNDGNDYFLRVVFNGSEVQALELTLVSDYPGMSEATTATKLLDFFESSVPDLGDTDVLANTVDGDIFVIVLNQDGEYRDGSAEVPAEPTPNLFYRVCPVNDIATPVIVDEDGEVCYVNHDGNFSVLRYNVATGVITEDSTDAVMDACAAFTQGDHELQLSTDASGNTVYTNGDYHIAVNNSGAIVDGRISEFESQNAIPVVGTVQVFADSGCTKYYSNKYAEKVYVRLNQQFTESVEYGDSKLTSFEISQNANAMSLYYDFNAPANLPKAAGIYQLDLEPDRTGIYFNNAVVFGNE